MVKREFSLPRQSDFVLDGKPYSKLKVVCPYTNLQFATEFLLRLEEPDTEFVDISHSDGAYFDLVEKLWGLKETFIIVEHDIVIWPGALHEIWECQEPLCAYQAPYNITPVGGRRGLSYGLGCLKWHQSLQEDFPNLVNDWPRNDRHWTRIDQVIVKKIAELNNDTIHYHWPAIGHLNRSKFPIGPLISEGVK